MIPVPSPPPPPPPAIVISVSNQAGISPYQLRAAERAVVVQVRRARVYWPQIPQITFGPGGTKTVTLERKYALQRCDTSLDSCCGPGADGCHGSDAAYVDRPLGNKMWTLVFSHEVLEMLNDPGGGVASDELCDPVGGQVFQYRIHGIVVSDFALPSYFADPQPETGPLDYRGKLRAWLRWWNH